MYQIQEAPNSGGKGTRIFIVQVKGSAEATSVWWTNAQPRCCACSGPLAGMSASCKHAMALRRYMNNRRSTR